MQGKGSAKNQSWALGFGSQIKTITAARRPTGPNTTGPHKQLLLGSVRGPPQVGAPAPVVAALAVTSVSVLRGPLVGAAAVPVHPAAVSRRL